MMGRYWVFSFETYYPGGGLNDFIGAFDTMEEAVARAEAEGDRHTQILDSVERKVIRTDQRDELFGGVWRCRSLDLEGDFEKMLERLFGDEIRADDGVGRELWSALTNVVWRHLDDVGEASFSYRGAGDVVAAIRGRGDHLDWYCRSPSGRVSERVVRLLAGEGWTFAGNDQAAYALGGAR